MESYLVIVVDYGLNAMGFSPALAFDRAAARIVRHHGRIAESLAFP